MNLEKFEKELHNRFNEHNSYELETKTLWTDLRRELDKEERRTGVGVIWLGIVILLIIIIFGVFYWNTGHMKPEKQLAAERYINTERLDVKLEGRADKSKLAISLDNELDIKVPVKKNPISNDPLIPLWTGVKYIETAEFGKIHDVNESSSLISILPQSKGLTGSVLPELDMLSLQIDGSINKKINHIDIEYGIDSKGIENDLLVSVEIGAHNMQQNISATGPEKSLETIRNDTEEPLTGWSVELSGLMVQSKGFAIGAGIKYTNNLIKFSYQSHDVFDVSIPDVPLDVVIDKGSLDTTVVRKGIANVDSTFSRQIQHFNKSAEVQIPLYAGMVKSNRRWIYGMLAGVSFNYELTRRGKMFDESGKIISIENEELFKKTSLSFIIKPLLGYHLNNGMIISARPQLAYTLTNKMKPSINITQRPWQAGLSVGVVKLISKNYKE